MVCVSFMISALKHLMKKVLERLMDTVVVVDDEDEEENVETSPRVHRSVHCSLGILCDWYAARTKVGAQTTVGMHTETWIVSDMYHICFYFVFVFFRNLPLVLQGKNVAPKSEMSSSSLLL